MRKLLTIPLLFVIVLSSGQDLKKVRNMNGAQAKFRINAMVNQSNLSADTLDAHDTRLLLVEDTVVVHNTRINTNLTATVTNDTRTDELSDSIILNIAAITAVDTRTDELSDSVIINIAAIVAVDTRTDELSDSVIINEAAIAVLEDSITAYAVDFQTGTLTTSGNVYTTMLHQDETWHMFGGFQDSAVVISITEDQWAVVTNSGGDLWTGVAASGFSMSGDTMIITNTGCYMGSFSVTFTGTNSNVIKFRVYNVTDGAAQGFVIAATGDGAADYVTITKPLHFHSMTAGDELVMQMMNIDASNDVTVRYGAFGLYYVHD